MKLPIIGRIAIGLSLVAVLTTPASTFAQDKPRYGGELTFVVPSEPPSFDGHREEPFGLIHPIAPHYNTLFRTDPTDRTGTKVIGDLAESWQFSKDSRTLSFKIRSGVKFHAVTLLAAIQIRACHGTTSSP